MGAKMETLINDNFARHWRVSYVISVNKEIQFSGLQKEPKIRIIVRVLFDKTNVVSRNQRKHNDVISFPKIL